MKYFVDFEAAQHSEEIIEIGLIAETGETFNHLVQSKRGLTPFITELTGICEEEYSRDAINADEAFSEIFSMIKDDDTPTFYCYGHSDASFLKHTFKNLKSFSAKAAMGIVSLTLTDYSKQVKKHFGLALTPSLWKVYTHYYPQPEGSAQQHRAIDDARILMEVCNAIEKDKSNENPFPEYTKTAIIERQKNRIENKENNSIIFGTEELKPMDLQPEGVELDARELTIAARNVKHKVALCRKGKVYKTFASINECANFICKAKNLSHDSCRRICGKIRTSHIQKKPYMEVYFVLFDEEN